MIDIKQLLPHTVYLALINANAPTALNPFITSSDITGGITSTFLKATGTAGAGFVELLTQSVDPVAGPASSIRLFSNSSGGIAWRKNVGADTFVRNIASVLTADRIYTLQNYDGSFITTTAAGSTGQILQSNGAASPSYSTATYPSASGTTGTFLRSNGTNNIYSTLTIPNTGAISSLLYTSAANVLAFLPTVNNSVLVTTAGGVPDWSMQLNYVTTSGLLSNTLSINAGLSTTNINANAGTAAQARFIADNGTSTITLSVLGTGFTTSGLNVANLSKIVTTSTVGLMLQSNTAATSIWYNIGGNTTATNIATMTSVGMGILLLGVAPTSTLQIGGSFAPAYIAKTATYTATISDYTIDCTANTFTVNLPTAVGITGRIYNIKNSTVTGVITADAAGTETIDGALTQTVPYPNNLQIQSNGANWIIL